LHILCFNHNKKETFCKTSFWKLFISLKNSEAIGEEKCLGGGAGRVSDDTSEERSREAKREFSRWEN